MSFYGIVRMYPLHVNAKSLTHSPRQLYPMRIMHKTSQSDIPSVRSRDALKALKTQNTTIIFSSRVAASDLRIGLNLLGEQGRKLLAEYIAFKQQ